MAGGEANTDLIRSIKQRRERLNAFSELLESGKTLFLPVMIAQRLSIEETRRLVESLKEWKLRIGKIIVNRVLPQDPSGDFMKRRKEQESKYLREIEGIFGKDNLIQIPLLEKDPVGPDDLRALGAYLEEILP